MPMVIPLISEYEQKITPHLARDRMPLFSIITVVKNNAQQLEATICSMLAQTWTDFELIVIDGASTDNFLAVMARYSDQRILYRSEPDLGIYDAMNKGIALAQGQIIGTLNAGDFYRNNTLELVAQAYEKFPQRLMAIAGAIESKSKNGFYQRQSAQMGFAQLDHRVHQPALFVTKAVYQHFGLFDPTYRIAADYEFVLRIQGQVPIVFLSQILTRTSPAGVSGDLYAATLEAYRARAGYYFLPLNGVVTGLKLLRVFIHLMLDRLQAWQFFERLRQRFQRFSSSRGDI